MVTRRALLVAGGAALLAGCGADEPAAEPPTDVLSDQLTAQRAAADAYRGLETRVPREARPAVRTMSTRAQARVHRLEAALRAAGGAAAAASPEAGEASLEVALARERAALAAHVRAIGALSQPRLRALGAGLVAGSAEDEAVLLGLLGRDPAPTAFPGQP